jgi:signal transduction histidine kinase
VPRSAAGNPWARYLLWFRAAIASAAVLLAWLGPGAGSAFFSGLLLAFAIYSIAAALRGRWPGGAWGLLTLFGDTVVFLIVAALGTQQSLWVPSLFYLFLMAQALVWHGPREVATVVVISSLFCAVTRYNDAELLGRTVVVSGVLATAFAVVRRRLNLRIEKLAQDVKASQDSAEKAREQERHRIASDFHDGPLQSFISLQMRIEIVRKLLERDVAAGMEDLSELQAIAQSQVGELRAFLRSMRPLDVDSANLFAAARRTAEVFQKESGIPVTFVGGNSPLSVSPEISAEVLQILREALYNARKHAGATRVAVAMEKADHTLEISVDDNGHGFVFAGSYSLDELEMLKLGPASLKRRARSLNAEMTLESRPGRGAGIKFRVPVS